MIVRIVKIINADSGKVVEREKVSAQSLPELSVKVQQMIVWWRIQKSNYTGYKAEYEEQNS